MDPKPISEAAKAAAERINELAAREEDLLSDGRLAEQIQSAIDTENARLSAERDELSKQFAGLEGFKEGAIKNILENQQQVAALTEELADSKGNAGELYAEKDAMRRRFEEQSMHTGAELSALRERAEKAEASVATLREALREADAYIDTVAAGSWIDHKIYLQRTIREALAADCGQALSEDKARMDWIESNRITITWNELRNGFVVQRCGQVVGNIGHGSLRDAIDAGMAAPSTGEAK